MATRKFRALETRPAGHVFYVPREARLAEDTKDRRHLLLHDCPDSDTEVVLATLAHLTTRETERIAHRAPFHRLVTPELQPGPKAEGSFVNAARLVFRDVRKLTHSVGQASPGDVRESRRVVADALEIGSPTPPTGLAGSVRGRLARVSGVLQKYAGFAFGIILTNHVYSTERRFQAIVPVVDLRTFLLEDETPDDFVQEETDVRPGNRVWCGELPSSWAEPVVDTVRLVTMSEEWKKSRDRNAWLPGQITVLDVGVDAETLREIERAVSRRLGLAVG
jgi:hypothetical protein